MGERLRRGGRLIMGSVVQVAIRPGAEVAADLGRVGVVAVSTRPSERSVGSHDDAAP